MRALDIDVAADYLLMAATLAHIKSRMLLPPDPDILGDDDGLDPRAELARRLAEYARVQGRGRDARAPLAPESRRLRVAARRDPSCPRRRAC